MAFLQFANRMEGSASDAFAGDFGEPAFNLVQPGSTRWREVHLVAGVIGETIVSRPGACAFRSCRESGARRCGGSVSASTLSQEPDELLMPVPGLAVSDDLASGNVKGGEQCGRAMPLVVVGLPFRNTWPEAAELAACGQAPESGSFHLRSARSPCPAGSDTAPQYPSLWRRTAGLC